jgi:cathepsin A (carboxypeptidase C)
VLIYAGDYDFICNWLGNQAWTLALEWSGKGAFNAATPTSWVVGGAAAGQVRVAGGLHFLRVFKAGHMVPHDQPEAALQMINTFIAGGKF